MEMTFTRRSFLGGAAALAVWPADLWGAAAEGGAGGLPPSLVSIWEHPDGTATDSVMVRRLYLDLAGRIPTKREAQAYVNSKDKDKRAALAGKLISSNAFADYWTMRFCDILRVKSEFPVNLWPNAVYVYHARVRRFVERNESWEEFGRALLTSQGSNFRDAEVNFFRATDRRNPDGWAEAVAQTFLGIRPTEISERLRRDFAGYLSNVRIKRTREWKEEIVFVDGPDRRAELCDRLFLQNRQSVAEAFMMRVREWLFGPVVGRRPVKDAKICGLKDAVRALVLSPEYARGSVTGGFPVRRLDAEILDDAFCALSGMKRNYQSSAPEPFTFIPPERPTVSIEDGSISSAFLSLFGRPARDTGLMEERGTGVTAKQRLYLYNSGDVHRKLTRVSMPRWKLPDGTVHPFHRLKPPKRVEELYWHLLSRAPSDHEQKIVSGEWRRRSDGGKNKKAKYGVLLRDVAWSLANSKEFIFRT